MTSSGNCDRRVVEDVLQSSQGADEAARERLFSRARATARRDPSAGVKTTGEDHGRFFDPFGAPMTVTFAHGDGFLERLRKRFTSKRPASQPSTTGPWCLRARDVCGSWQKSLETPSLGPKYCWGQGAEPWEKGPFLLPVAERCWWRNELRRQPQAVLLWTK